MRIAEHMVLQPNGDIEGIVEESIFIDELEEFGLETNVFTIEGGMAVKRIIHKETGRDLSAEFDLEETARDIAFSSTRSGLKEVFYGDRSPTEVYKELHRNGYSG